MLILTALIWGTAFVAQSVGMDYVEPFTFNGVRCLIGAVALLPCIWLLGRINNQESETGTSKEEKNVAGLQDRKTLWIGGIACGLCLFAASSLQQYGIQYTTAGKAGFITAFYIIFVPVLGIFLKKKIGWKVWCAVVLAVVGLYFLCITESFTIGQGDIYILGCALAYSLHIMVVDHFSPKVDGVKMSCIQFLVAGLLSIPCMLLWETPVLAAIWAARVPILYAGVMSCGVAYTLQIIAQKDMNPAIASLLMSLESSFSVLAGWMILHEVLSRREALGCVLMFAAIILAQLPEKKDYTILQSQP
jgi:drug/metabolite transporter (DMT)-like permease